MTNKIEFLKSGEWVMRITADRRIEVNEGITVTEAAQKVLEALQTLLEQPEQKPVAWMDRDGDLYRMPVIENWSPPQRQPLTDAEIEATFLNCNGKWDGDQWVIEDADFHPFARAINEAWYDNTPQKRWARMRQWVEQNIKIGDVEAAHGIKDGS